MRGKATRHPEMFHAFTLSERVPHDHPLRRVLPVCNAALRRLERLFDQAYGAGGRPSIPPEALLRALVVQTLYGIQSERRLCDAINYNLLFMWFVGVTPEAGAWHATTFTKNRDRFLAHGVVQAFFDEVLAELRARELLDDEEFAVDGTLIESFASAKSVRPIAETEGDDGTDDGTDGGRPRDTNGWANFKGATRSNDTHRSTTDPEARLKRKGKGREARLGYEMHALVGTNSGLIVGLNVTQASGKAEREAALELLDHVAAKHGITPKALAADKAYDAGAWLLALEARGIVPAVALRDQPPRAHTPEADARRRMKRRSRSRASKRRQRERRLVEQCFGWIKRAAGFVRSSFEGGAKTELAGLLAGIGYNLIRACGRIAVPRSSAPPHPT